MTKDQSEIRKLKRQIKITQDKLDFLLGYMGLSYDETTNAFTMTWPTEFGEGKINEHSSEQQDG